MSKIYDAIDETLIAFIRAQHLFFVATAPLAGDGLLNLSPKGLDTFRILGPKSVAYLDLTGSGIETTAHIRENGRIILVFCAFEGAPKILRLHGRGVTLEPGHAEHDALAQRFPAHPGARGIIKVEVTRIADSCGYAIPRYAYEGERDQLDKWSVKKGAEGLAQYRREKNAKSLDGLPGIDPPAEAAPGD
jgi:hypothetical protein